MWMVDPVSGAKSVSLTMLVIAGALFSGCSLLLVFGRVNTTGPLENFFWGAVALYFGRRNLNINGKSFSAPTDQGNG